MSRLYFSLCLVLCLAGGASGQEFRASITGEITDPSGAPVDGATVSITSIERNVTTGTESNSSGRYLIQDLLQGSYTLTIEKAGFKKVVREDIKLSTNDHLGLNFSLEVGAVAESVTVTGQTSQLQTENANVNTLVQNRAVENIPTDGRNLYQLQYTLPGVVKTSNYWGSMELYAQGNVDGVSISGGVNGQNETLIDGVANTQSGAAVNFVPALAATQEFTLQSNQYDAAYGRVGGGVTSINLKSGTNELHGQLFEFFKNDVLNANDWVANKEGDPRQRFLNNTYGFEVAGPVFLPKLFDGRNRLFFMVSLESLRESSSGSTATTVPTLDEVQGNFQGFLNDQGQQVTIYDPLTTKLGPGGNYVRTPFPGNAIPKSRINPVAAAAAAFYPAPTSAGDESHFNNYFKPQSAHNTYDEWLGKLDYHISDKSNLSFRYGQMPWEDREGLLWGNNAADPSNQFPATRVARNFGFDWTYTISPTMVFDLRGGLSRWESFSGNDLGKNFDPTALGFPASLVSQFTTLQFPEFGFNNYNQLGSDHYKSYVASDNWSLTPGMTWVKGKHIFKYGFELRRYNDNSIQPGTADGVYNFDNSWTQADPLQGDNASGNEFASFLLGYPTSGSVANNIDTAYHNWYYAAYFQDDFKIKPTLTINLGLRWDYESPRKERYNRMVAGFGVGALSPLASQVAAAAGAANCPACSRLTGGLEYASTGGLPSEAFDSFYNNFQPRVGMAWSFLPKWVMRGGYGLMYLGQSANGPATGYSQTTGLIASIDGGITPAISLSDPYPLSLYPTGLLKPIGNSEGLATNLGQSVNAQYRDRPLAYSQQYSFGLQHEFRGGWLVDVSYVGNTTNRLPENLNLNFIPRNILTSMPLSQRAAYFTQAVTNPFAGLLPNSSFNGSTVPLQQLLYAYPQFSQVTMTNVPIGWQRYDALEAKATRRFAQGLSMQVSYTYSKTLEKVAPLNAQDVNLTDLTNTPLEKRLNQWSLPHKFALVVSYELPFGRGKRFGNNMNRWVNGVAGGWNLNAQTVKQSGFPVYFPNAAPLTTGSAFWNNDQRDKAAQANGQKLFDPSVNKWFNTSLFPSTAISPYDLRTFPTMFPDVRGQSPRFTEISVFKEFSIRDRVRWQIRADFHNALNFPYFGKFLAVRNNQLDVTNSQFGQLDADISNETRLIVMVMKVTF